MTKLRMTDLTNRLPACTLVGEDLELAGIAIDSRQVRSGDLFAALPGVGVHGRLDGRDFIPQALERGAAALLLPTGSAAPPNVPHLLCQEARLAAGMIAQIMADDPSRKLKLLGVTGTNGKSTCVHLLHHLLDHADESWGVLGTLRYEAGGETMESTHTTPDPVSLARLLAAAVDAGQAGMAMEVSSHALDQHRVAGCAFAGVMFTNISRDHLDYHGDMEGYFAAKRRLLTLRAEGAPVLLNQDDIRLAELHSMGGGGLYTYGRHAAADYRITAEEHSAAGSVFTLCHPGGETRFRTALPGMFNVSNAAGALALAISLGAEPLRLASRLATFAGVPGRMEMLQLEDGPVVVIDFAHTPDAVEKILAACRPLCSGKLIALFGAGGEKDEGKRPLMGQAAQAVTDDVWLTSDNPRGEDPDAILAAIEKGMDQSAGSWHKEVDRARAIGLALESCGAGDMLVLLGKGHERTQEIEGRFQPFNDLEVAQTAWLEIGERK
ncbi:MAG: UDP-N-acetylmuramoyl-L-alanyl-D-glutamate--2,6-diaminopimelate ligase [bacterium]|nr:UDP-N-acetylmuramoyl-L-alanyl-D-glutamate--2,6-diaminopimelate ligase [bacterium]